MGVLIFFFNQLKMSQHSVHSTVCTALLTTNQSALVTHWLPDTIIYELELSMRHSGN